MAWPFRILLVVAVAALGVGVLIVASGGLGRVAASIGGSFGSFVSNITATAVPSASAVDVADAPDLVPPDEPYTNQPTVDIVGTVPDALVGDTGSRIRLYVALGDQPPGIVTQVPVGETAQFTIPDVKLSPGTNTFTATIIGPTDLESDASAAVTYILDKSKPRITVSSPKNNSTVNGGTVRIVGQTQGRSNLSVTNASTGKTVNGAADAKGAFSIVVGLRTGTNTLQIAATDPAGNQFTATLTVLRGTGKLTASLNASDYSIPASSLPETVTVAVTVTNPDGQRLSGANCVFTLTVPGLPAIVSPELTTDGSGRASFTTTIAKGATKGQTKVTVMVTTSQNGSTSDLTVINIT
jgi:glucodextranase-like protein